MLYNIKTGHGVPKQPMADILILVSSLRKLGDRQIPFVFSDRHAYLKTARFSDQLDDLDRIIWPVLQVRDFKKDDADKFEKYQAEALIYQHMPVNALIGIACYNRVVRDEIRELAVEHGAEVEIFAQSSWYL